MAVFEAEFPPVASDLADFPALIDLAQAPELFWATVSEDGGNIRAYAGGNECPLDIVTFRHEGKAGTIAVQLPVLSAAGTVITLETGAQTRLPRNDPNGSAAVWNGFASVFLGGENTDDRASATRVVPVSGDGATFLNERGLTFGHDPHQGGTWHRASGEFYTADNNDLRRFDAAGNLLVSNTNPNAAIMAATGMTGLTHVCDICVVNDWLIVPTNNYPTNTKSALAVFDRTTLTLVSAVNITSTDILISSICWNPEIQRLVTCSWGTFTRLYRYALNMTTGAIAPDGFIPLNKTGTGDLNNAAQGIEWWRGHYWISDDNRDEVVRVKPDGSYHINDCPMQFSDNSAASVAGNYEGLFVYKDGLAVLVDPTSADSYLIYSQPANFPFGGGGARYGTNNGYFQATGLTGGTTFTLAVSCAPATAKQAAILTYRDLSSGATNDRATIAHRAVGTGYQIEVWDNLNGWLSSPVLAQIGVWNRIVAVYSGATRRLYVDGVLRATQTGITPRDNGFDTLTIGHDDESNAASFDGDIAFATLRMSAFSDDWVAADHAMVSNPAFCTIRFTGESRDDLNL